jgi:putative solute:sodium symporter small subunit
MGAAKREARSPAQQGDWAMAVPNGALEYWRKTRNLMWFALAVWFIFGFGIHFFVEWLNQFTFLSFPLGYYMAAQGSLIVFVVLIFWFAARQNRIDEEFGVAED